MEALTDADIARAVAKDPNAVLILTEAETVAAMVRTLRKQLGFSQAAFAAVYHIAPGTLRD